MAQTGDTVNSFASEILRHYKEILLKTGHDVNHLGYFRCQFGSRKACRLRELLPLVLLSRPKQRWCFVPLADSQQNFLTTAYLHHEDKNTHEDNQRFLSRSFPYIISHVVYKIILKTCTKFQKLSTLYIHLNAFHSLCQFNLKPDSNDFSYKYKNKFMIHETCFFQHVLPFITTAPTTCFY